MKKKTLTILMLILLLATMVFVLIACDKKGDDTFELVYRLSADKTYYTVIGAKKVTGKVVIPSEYEGKPVKAIGDSAFDACKDMTEIELSSNITSIGEGAFGRCDGLTSIVIPSSVTHIGNYAFSRGLIIYCEAESLPSGWENIWSTYNPVVWNYGGECGKTADGIKWGKLKDETITITGCDKATTELTIPETINGHTVTGIADYGFYEYINLTSLKMPSVTNIGKYAFFDCSSLTSVEIPSGLSYIESQMFANCDNAMFYCELSSQPSEWEAYWNGHRIVVWNYCGERGVTQSGIKWSFLNDGTVAITGHNGESSEISIPSTINGQVVSSIVEMAFFGYESLTDIIIPSSVKNIGDSAFTGCRNLTIYYEGDKVPSGWIDGWNYHNRPVILNFEELGVTQSGIKWYLASGSVTVTEYNGSSAEVSIPATINGHSITSICDNAFYENSRVTRIEIPSSVTNIGDRAFYNCSNLIDIAIPRSVSSIGHYAFAGCVSLEKIEIPDSVFTMGNDVFSGCAKLTIYCEAQVEPSEWKCGYWNLAKIPVVWGHIIED